MKHVLNKPYLIDFVKTAVTLYYKRLKVTVRCGENHACFPTGFTNKNLKGVASNSIEPSSFQCTESLEVSFKPFVQKWVTASRTEQLTNQGSQFVLKRNGPPLFSVVGLKQLYWFDVGTKTCPLSLPCLLIREHYSSFCSL